MVAGAVLVLWATPAPPASAQTPAGYDEYLVPFDEDIFVYVTTEMTTSPVPAAGDTTKAVASLTAWADTVTIYFDHWENGYVTLTPTDAGFTADEVYTVSAGETLAFTSNAVPRPRTGPDGNTYVGSSGNCTGQTPPKTPVSRTTPDYCYDGRDRIFSVGGATTLTRGGLVNTTGVGIRAAIGEEVYPLTPQLIKYILPFGEDGARSDYERVFAVIQATEDDTSFQIDFDGGDWDADSFNTVNGYRTARTSCPGAGCTLDTSLTLHRGQSYILDRDSDGTLGGLLPRGIVVLANKTLQVEYFYGDDNPPADQWNTRGVSAYPRGFWSDEYYAPVDGSTGGYDTDVLLHNPSSSGITVSYETTAGSGSFALAANETAFFQVKTGGSYVPDGSALYLKGTGAFWGVSDVDNNSTYYDWSYSLVPTYLLQSDQVVSWAPGNDPVLACSSGEGRDNGLFVTPAFDNTTFYIDKDQDGTPDTDPSIEVLLGPNSVTATGDGYRANRLQSLYITGSRSGDLTTSPCDLTGARIYATGPFSLAYGQNPAKASGAGGLDLGYTVLPNPANWMDLALTVEKATNPVLISTTDNPGTATYTLTVETHEFPLDTVRVVDKLAFDWTYTVGTDTTTITLPDLTTVTTDPTVTAPGAALPSPWSGNCPSGGGDCLTWPDSVFGAMEPNQTVTIVFTARTLGTPSYVNGDISRNLVQATGTRDVGGVVQTFNASDFVFNSYVDASADMEMEKVSSVAETTPVSPGDPLTYTVTIDNAGTGRLTGITLSDDLPAGVTSSGPATLSHSNVADRFSTALYTNQNGTRNWAGNWIETNDGGGATGDDILILNGELQLNNDDALASSIIYRRVDLAPSGAATAAVLSFKWRTTAGVDAADRVEVCGRRQATDGWTCPLTNGDFTGISGVASGTYSVDLAYLGALTATAEISFQFRANTYYTATAANESFFVDDLSITYDVGVTPTSPLGTPPTVLSLYSLVPGDTLTAQIPVTVDNPFPAGQTDIVNVATVTAREIPVPLTDDARNIVVNPSSSSASVGDRVWMDLDADGVLDPGESGIAGIEVTLKDEWGTPIAVTTTDTQGRYLFTNVPPGSDYFVAVTGGLPEASHFVRDEFGTVAYDNNDGDMPWAGSWSETNDGATGAASGFVRVDSGALQVRYDGGAVPPDTSVQRTVDLNAFAGVTNPLLSFSSVSCGTLGTGDNMVVEASGTGGAPWTTLATSTDGGAFLPGGPYNLTLYKSATTTIRFRVTGGYSTGAECLAIDNVNIGYTIPTLTQTTDSRTDLRTNDFDLAAGQEYLDADLGFKPAAGTAVFGDLVWSDADGDGVRDPGEPGLGGVTVSLYGDVDGDGDMDTLTTTTASDGSYLFTGINADGVRDYSILVDTGQVALTGYSATTLTTFLFEDVDPNTAQLTADFGFRNASNLTVTDRVWLDNGAGGGTANDGIQNGSEPGIAGVTVGLVGGTIIASATTGPDGTFQFAGLPAGVNYTWAITDDAGVLDDYFGTCRSGYTCWSQERTFQMVGGLTANLDFSVNQEDYCVGYPTSNYPCRQHFGYNVTRAIGDTVWVDNGAGGGTANDGIRNGSEAGIAGVTVLLYRDVNGNNVLDDAVAATLTTDASGNYLFTGLVDGARYWVSVDDTQAALASYDNFSPPADAESGVAGHQRKIDVLSGTYLDADFGYWATTSYGLSGRLWNDNGDGGGTAEDGNQNGTEPGFSGVTIELLRDCPGTCVVAGSTTTAADGTYSFTGLPAGNYRVRVTDDGGVLAGHDTTHEETEQETGPFNGYEDVTLGPGSASNIDFGYYKEIPTRAVVSRLRAYVLGGRTVVEWRTAAEDATVAFDLYRRVRPAEEGGKPSYVKVNPRVLPALIFAPVGGVYRLVDEAVGAGERQVYFLREHEARHGRHDRSRWHGPYLVKVEPLPPAEAVAQAGDLAEGFRAVRLGPSRAEVDRLREARVARAERARRGPAASRSRVWDSDAVARLTVKEPGLFRVTAGQIAAWLGLDPADAAGRIARHGYTLRSQDREVPYLAEAGGSALVFHNPGLETVYTDTNVFWLATGRSGVAMGAVEAQPSGATGAETFQRTVRAESNVESIVGLGVFGPEEDYWVWSYLIAGSGTECGSLGTKCYAVATPAPASSGTAVLEIDLVGGSDLAVSPDHRFVALVGGVQVGEVSWDGVTTQTLTAALDASLIQEGTTAVTVRSLNAHPEDPSFYGAAYVDEIRLTYPSFHRAEGDRLAFGTEDASEVLLSGFTASDVRVVDVTDPWNPTWLVASASALPGGGYGVALQLPAGRRYVAAAGVGVRTADGRATVPTRLRDTDLGAEYLVVTPADLRPAAERLAELRRSSGLSAAVVDVEEVMDAYNQGINSPWAIRAFLSDAVERWSSPPRYVVLAGSGSFDYRDYKGHGDSLVPPLMVSTPFGLAASDGALADVKGDDGVPDLAVGRLPFLTAAELDAYVDRVSGYEGTPAAAWTGRVLLVADNTDVAGDFAADSDDLALRLNPVYSVERAYLSYTSSTQAAQVAATRQAIKASLDGGVGYFSFLGHGSVAQLADEGLFKTSDVGAMLNGVRRPVATLLTCVAGNFALPGYDSLGEALVLKADGGAIAVWGPSGLSLNDEARVLGQSFYKTATTQPDARLGDQVLGAHRAYAPGLRFVHGIYNLLGDPALRPVPAE